MTRAFRFALQAAPRESRRAWHDLARRAEDLGYTTLQVADHLGMVDPFTPLVSAADATSTLRLGTLVVNSELHNPVLLARQAATVDLLSDGRLELGLGTGYAQNEHDAAGIPLAPPRERVTRFEAAVRIVRDLLSSGRALHDGPHRVAVDDFGVACVQQPHPPLLVGGHGRRVLGVAARHAQIVQFTGLTPGAGGWPEPGGYARSVIAERVRWVEEAAGERSGAIELSALVQRTHVGDGAAAVVEEWAGLLGQPASVVTETPFLLLGTLEAVCEKLQGLREELGLSYFTVRDADGFAPVVARLTGT
jgi:probable F420-dependent oxidoreductase